MASEFCIHGSWFICSSNIETSRHDWMERKSWQIDLAVPDSIHVEIITINVKMPSRMVVEKKPEGELFLTRS